MKFLEAFSEYKLSENHKMFCIKYCYHGSLTGAIEVCDFFMYRRFSWQINIYLQRLHAYQCFYKPYACVYLKPENSVFRKQATEFARTVQVLRLSRRWYFKSRCSGLRRRVKLW